MRKVEDEKAKAHKILADHKRQVSTLSSNFPPSRRGVGVCPYGPEAEFPVQISALCPLTPIITLSPMHSALCSQLAPCSMLHALCSMRLSPQPATRSPHPATSQSSSGVKVTTSSISVASQNSITRRSIPSAMPPASGMSFKAFKNFSGIG